MTLFVMFTSARASKSVWTHSSFPQNDASHNRPARTFPGSAARFSQRFRRRITGPVSVEAVGFVRLKQSSQLRCITARASRCQRRGTDHLVFRPHLVCYLCCSNIAQRCGLWTVTCRDMHLFKKRTFWYVHSVGRVTPVRRFRV